MRFDAPFQGFFLFSMNFLFTFVLVCPSSWGWQLLSRGGGGFFICFARTFSGSGPNSATFGNRRSLSLFLHNLFLFFQVFLTFPRTYIVVDRKSTPCCIDRSRLSFRVPSHVLCSFCILTNHGQPCSPDIVDPELAFH